MRMLAGVTYYSKSQWKTVVWGQAWELEKEDWSYRKCIFKSTVHFRLIENDINYLIWWHISYVKPSLLKQSEVMAKIVHGASNLKGDNQRLCNELRSTKTCVLCDLHEIEDARHLICNCPSLNDLRHK